MNMDAKWFFGIIVASAIIVNIALALSVGRDVLMAKQGLEECVFNDGHKTIVAWQKDCF